MSSTVFIVTAVTETVPVLVLTQVLSSGNKAAQCHVTTLTTITMCNAMYFQSTMHTKCVTLFTIYNKPRYLLSSAVCPSVEVPPCSRVSTGTVMVLSLTPGAS